jgi:hypothetical protein
MIKKLIRARTATRLEESIEHRSGQTSVLKLCSISHTIGKADALEALLIRLRQEFIINENINHNALPLTSTFGIRKNAFA